MANNALANLDWVLDPEAFPFYYSMTAPFLLNGVASGAAGALAQLTRELNNFPHLFYGIRISNVYALDDIANAAAWTAVRQLDSQQTIRVELAQQNITAQATFQSHVTGGTSGAGGEVIHWHPLPKPYPLAGGNSINMTVTRLTGYPALAQGVVVLPVVFATIVTSVHRKDFRTVPPERRLAP